MSNTGTFNLAQQAFVLSLSANFLGHIEQNRPGSKKGLETRLYTYLTKEYLPAHTDLVGLWDIIWGPAVFSTGGMPDNTTLVFRRHGGTAYVVATAGTNLGSFFAKQDEDAHVETTVSWSQAFREDLDGEPLLGDYGNPLGTDGTNPCLSSGTAVGVRAVLATRPSAGVNPAFPAGERPPRLAEFLRSLPSASTSDATIVITGHSLGGALSPTLALALFNPSGGPCDASRWAHVYTLPTAGATPGNSDFASLFAHVFPPTPTDLPRNPDLGTIEAWNRNVANTKDFVPMAWIPDRLRAASPKAPGGGIYPHLRFKVGLPSVLDKVVKMAAGKPEKAASSRPFAGDVQPSAVAGAYATLPLIEWECDEIEADARIEYLVPKGPDQEAASYLHHWLLQHTVAYTDQIFRVGAALSKQKVTRLVSGGPLVRLLEEFDDEKDE